MDLLRTPDEHFENLEGYPFEPNYLEVGDGLRMHYVDEPSADGNDGAAPVLMLHGEADDIIPIRYAERLLALVQGEKRLVRYPGGYHVNLDRLGAADEALRFLGLK